MRNTQEKYDHLQTLTFMKQWDRKILNSERGPWWTENLSDVIDGKEKAYLKSQRLTSKDAEDGKFTTR